MLRCTTRALYRSKLWQQHPQNLDSSTCPGWWKQSFRLQLWCLVWFQVRIKSCHLTSSKPAWKSTPKCTWSVMIPWCNQVAGARPWLWQQTRCRPTNPRRPRLGFRRSATTLYPSLTEYSPSSRQGLWKRLVPSFWSVSRWWLRLMATTLNRCQLYLIIKLAELIFFNKNFKIKL